MNSKISIKDIIKENKNIIICKIKKRGQNDNQKEFVNEPIKLLQKIAEDKNLSDQIYSE